MAQEKLNAAEIRSAADDDDVDLDCEMRLNKLPTGTTQIEDTMNESNPENSSVNNLMNGQADMKNMKDVKDMKDIKDKEDEEKSGELNKVNVSAKPKGIINGSEASSIHTLPNDNPTTIQQMMIEQRKFQEQQILRQTQMQNQFLSTIKELMQRGVITEKSRPNPKDEVFCHDYRYDDTGPDGNPIRNPPASSISDHMDAIYSQPMSENKDNAKMLVIPDIDQEKGNYLVGRVKRALQMNGQKKKGGEDNGDKKDDEKQNDDQNQNDGRNNRNQRQNDGINFGNAHGNGRRSGRDRDRNDGNDNNDRNNDGNGNGNNFQIAQTLEALAENQSRITKLMEKKDKSSYTKLPKCNIKYYGKKNDGSIDDLVKKAWEVRLWCKTKGIDESWQYNIWMSDVLQSPAKEQIYLQGDDIQDFDSLITKLGEIYPIQSKIFSKINDYNKFRYIKKTSMDQHLNRYKVICHEMNKERWVWKYISKQGRAPELPTFEKQWRVLLKSIEICPDLHKKTLELVQKENENIFRSTYALTKRDINLLTKAMQNAAIMLYPSNEMIRYDITDKPRFGTSFRGNKRDRDSNGKGKRYSRTNKRNRDNKKQMNYQNAKTEFTGKCYACGEIHQVRYCQNKQKKKQYCYENDLCLFCCKDNHKVGDCKSRQEWEKNKNKKKAGNKGNGNNNKRKKWSRKAIRYAEKCKFKHNCRDKQSCFWIHDNDYQITDDEANDDGSNNSQNSQNEDLRREQINLLNVSTKEKVYAAKVRSTLETCRIDRYKLGVDQIPDGELITLYFKQSSEEMAKHPALNDGGSTISAITPLIAEKVMKQTGLKAIKSRKFLVENASGKDVEFQGEYLLIPTLIPNTNAHFEDIKYYIMPNNQCAYGIILGLNDSKRLRYRTGLEVEPGKLLFRHRGDHRRRKFDNVERANSIIERIAKYPGPVLGNSHIECYKNEKVINEINEDSFNEDDDSECTAEDSSDEDSEDGIRSH